METTVIDRSLTSKLLKAYHHSKVQIEESSHACFEKVRDGTAGGKSQIVCTPLQVKHVSAGKSDWIFFYLKSPIDFTVF